VEKTVDKLIAYPGDEVSYSIVVTNEGDENAEDVMVEDVIPEYLEVDEASITGGATYDEGVITWEGDLAIGASVTFTFNGTVTADVPEGRVVLNAASAESHFSDGYGSAVTEAVGFEMLYLPLVNKK
jgi:uncharacterized repeat protein (TIGR01451 family)